MITFSKVLEIIDEKNDQKSDVNFPILYELCQIQMKISNLFKNYRLSVYSEYNTAY